VFDAQGAVSHFVAVKEDITTQKSLETELLHAQKLESVGRLAGGIAHDFNNMLQAIIGYTALALARVNPSGQLGQDLREIRKAAEHSASLTRQLLAFARRQPINPIALNLNDVVAAVFKMLERLIGEDIELVWRPGDGLWFVKVDPHQIEQVLANLAVNARDAMTGGGTLAIQTSNMVVGKAYYAPHVDVVPGEYVLLEVSDTGSGMEKEVAAHVFEPFYTTKEVGKGTGLGLATAYGIVKQHDGLILLDSTPGQGTTFRILLPRVIEESHDVQTASGTTAPVSGNETVLVVEDEPAILDIAKRVLEENGYTVFAAQTTKEALALWDEHSGQIDLLITDVVMPGMSGKELKESFTSRKPGLKYLYISGYTADLLANRGVLNEGVHFLQKPFDVQVFVKQVRHVLDT
jgi:nitrogen-specific signal transduction histidine kinase